MANKIILVGAINKGNVPTCGETMKNQLFIKRFVELFDEVIPVDTLGWKKNPWVLFRLFFVLLFNRDAKVIISASRGASYLISFLYYVPLNKNVYFWVVGGNLHRAIQQGRYNVKALSALKRILVQGKSMVDELQELGLTNVLHVPNSKPISFKPTLSSKKDDMIRFVFLSRVHPHKGIKEIYQACKSLIDKGYSGNFCVHFYGKIEPSYQTEFDNYIDKLPNFKYKGFLNLTNNDGYRTLSSYDVMLFPTYWVGEGFPGVVIDANMSGLPIIATDWNMNREVIEDGKTGFIIPPHDNPALADAMEKFIRKEIDLYAMKQFCINYISKYDYRNVLSEELMKQIELMDLSF